MNFKQLVSAGVLLTWSLTACHVEEEGGGALQNTIAILPTDGKSEIIEKATRVVPSPNQLVALEDDFVAFIHFGPNTFTGREWGTGKESPEIFNPKGLDAGQWCRALKAAGVKKVVLTAKHHDGFCLWPSRYTTHSVISSPYKDGGGDVVKELADACKKYGLKLGIYLSPADLYQMETPEGLYGNLSPKTKRTIPREVPGRPFQNKTMFTFEVDDYNEYYLNQLFELLTEYGPIAEVWLDGAHPKRKGNQTYDYAAWKEVIHRLAPEAVIFGREDIRWCGNEAGRTRDTEWNVIPYQEDPNTLNHFGDLTAQSLGSDEDLLKAKFLHYQPAQVNTSIRDGWFYRDALQEVRTSDDIFDIYERAVGGNAIFMLNIPPNRDGLFEAKDAERLAEVGKRIRETYGVDFFEEADTEAPAEVTDKSPASYFLVPEGAPEIVFTKSKPMTINRLLIQEAVSEKGERIARHALDAWIDGEWREIASATNVGYKRILRFPEVTSEKFRLRILESRAQPGISKVSAFYSKYPPAPTVFPTPVSKTPGDGQIH